MACHGNSAYINCNCNIGAFTLLAVNLPVRTIVPRAHLGPLGPIYTAWKQSHSCLQITTIKSVINGLGMIARKWPLIYLFGARTYNISFTGVFFPIFYLETLGWGLIRGGEIIRDNTVC